MQTALTASEGSVTYATFEERSHRLSLYLRDIGTSEAVIALPFGIDYFVALHACMRCGLKAVPLDLSLPRDVLNEHLERLSDV
jgi:acyl-CoA synthetase (AMP-forming)/AMP-acid ligase II